MFSDHNEIKFEINNKKNPNISKVNNTSLNNSWAKDEIKSDSRKCFEVNGQKLYQYSWDIGKAIHSLYTIFSASKSRDLRIYISKPGKKSKVKPNNWKEGNNKEQKSMKQKSSCLIEKFNQDKSQFFEKINKIYISLKSPDQTVKEKNKNQ